jgi:hypothetical protein
MNLNMLSFGMGNIFFSEENGSHEPNTVECS